MILSALSVSALHARQTARAEVTTRSRNAFSASVSPAAQEKACLKDFSSTRCIVPTRTFTRATRRPDARRRTASIIPSHRPNSCIILSAMPPRRCWLNRSPDDIHDKVDRLFDSPRHRLAEAHTFLHTSGLAADDVNFSRRATERLEQSKNRLRIYPVRIGETVSFDR